MKHWPIVFCLFICGCVLPSDLARLEQSQVQKEARIEGAIASLEADAISEDQAKAIIGAAIDTYNDDVEDVVETATNRALDAVDAVKEGAISMTELVGGGAGVGGVLAVLLNLYRNSTRRREIDSAVKGST